MCDQEFPSMRALSNHMMRIHHSQIPQLDGLCEKAVEEAPAKYVETNCLQCENSLLSIPLV